MGKTVTVKTDSETLDVYIWYVERLIKVVCPLKIRFVIQWPAKKAMGGGSGPVTAGNCPPPGPDLCKFLHLLLKYLKALKASAQ